MKKKEGPHRNSSDPLEGKLVQLQEVANRRQLGNRTAQSVRQAEVSERVLRRILENSLECAVPATKSHLKIIK